MIRDAADALGNSIGGTNEFHQDRRAICCAMPAGSAARDFSFRKPYDSGGSSVSMTYGLICYAPIWARLLFNALIGGLHHRLMSSPDMLCLGNTSQRDLPTLDRALRPRRRRWTGPDRWLRPWRRRHPGRTGGCRCRRGRSRRSSAWRNCRCSSRRSRRCGSSRRCWCWASCSRWCRCRTTRWRYANVINVLFVLSPARVEVERSSIRHIAAGVI